MNESWQARQGDVFLERIAALPAGAAERPNSGGEVVLAYGEVTGHKHRIVSDEVRLWDAASQTYLVVPADADLVHDEHHAIAVPAGTYRVTVQREYHPDAIRSVAD